MGTGRVRVRSVFVAFISIAAFLGFTLAGPAAALGAAPAPPVVVSPASSKLVASSFVITGRVDAGVTQVRVVGAAAATVTLEPADSTGATFTVGARVDYGRTSLEISASDGASWSEPAVLTVWALGKVTSVSPQVLVDKSDFMLYVIRSGRVVAAYPVATGMRGAATPIGVFHLGRPVRSPSSVWGVFRMRLYKHRHVRVAYTVRVKGRRVRRWRIAQRMIATSFYIHGTNDPDSIGTRASHGCVRMFNRDLRILKTLTYKYEYVRIRP
jgi:lipoprotein-anchoring transpeptidase ErfK/SrfK